jgi:hypothetical protein
MVLKIRFRSVSENFGPDPAKRTYYIQQDVDSDPQPSFYTKIFIHSCNRI